MKHLRYVALLSAILIALLAFSAVGAQGNWTTGIDIQSLDSANGTVVVEFFDDTGNPAGQLDDTISGFGSLSFYLPSQPAPSAPGNYSAVVSADVEIAATVSLQNYDLGGADIYLGTGLPESSLTFPLVYRNHTSGKWNSQLSVQNASTSAQDVTLNLFTSGESTPDVTKTVNIPGNATYNFDISDQEYAAFGPFGSGTVSGTDPLAGVAISIRNPGTGSVNVIESSYRAFGSAQFGQEITLPLVYKNFNLWTTGINVVNTGNSDTEVTIQYESQRIVGGPWIDSMVIGPNAMGVFYTPSNGSLPDGFYGSATLVSDTNDILVVAASQRYRASGAEGVAYEGSVSSQATGCVGMPIVHNRTSWKTGINILNTGASEANITIDYKSSAGGIPDASENYTIPAGSPLTVYMPSDAATQLGFYGAGDLKSDQPVLVNVANSRSDRGVSSNYVGINYTCPAP